MVNNYDYLDSEFIYTDPKTGVLRNLAEITDAEGLVFFESTAVTKRLKELELNPLKIKNANSLLIIHKYLFQDVYAWAGKVRTVEISKEGTPFLPTAAFDTGFAYVDRLLMEYRKIAAGDLPPLAGKLAELLDSINHLHPFREGNGRTQREFLRTLALEKGIVLNLNPPDNLDIYERYMQGTIQGDIEILKALFLELIGSK